MKRVFLFLLIAGLTTTAFSQKTESRKVSDFTGIDAAGIFDITVVKGNSESLAIKANDDVMPYVRSEVNNGVLRLYIDKNDLVNTGELKAVITMKNLDNVLLSGACKLTANGLFTPDNFKAVCSDISIVTVNVKTNQLNVELSSASVANLTGSANDLKASASGISVIKAENLRVKNADVKVSEMCKATVNVTTHLKAEASGGASVTYKGSPSVDSNSSGMSKIEKM